MRQAERVEDRDALAASVRLVLSITLLGVILTLALDRAKGRDADRLDGVTNDYRIDVNRADAHLLELLPGVGPSIAENLIYQRETSGPFFQPEDLQGVLRIGPVLSERMSPWIEFGAGPEPPFIQPGSAVAANAGPH